MIKPSVRRPKQQESPLVLAGFFTFLLLWGGIFSLAYGQNKDHEQALTENQALRAGRVLADSTALSSAGKWSFSGYIESYYGFDFGQPFDQLRPDFFFNFKRHNELTINFALAQASYSDGRHRATLGLMAGTYAQFNLADEPTWAQFIYEASVGYLLHEKVWLDVGIMPSHIGFESAIGAVCDHLTRSLLAENSPYFLTGARLTYALHPQHTLVLWATNGWQNVQRQPGVQGIGLGLQVESRLREDWTISYANYYGNEGVQPVQRPRFFQNFYTHYEGLPGWKLTLGVDYGIQAGVLQAVDYWQGATVSVRRLLSERLALAARLEQYADPAGTILANPNRLSGYSLNVDYRTSAQSLFRIEYRQLASDRPSFLLPDAGVSRFNSALTASFSLFFGDSL